jgi:hypothetical protein
MNAAKRAIGAEIISPMAAKNQKGADSVPLDPSILDWAEYWYPISWKGVLFGGLVTAVGACATIGFLLLQWRTTTIREEQSELRTSSLETQTSQANAALGIAQADIAKAHAQIADANAREKEAELKLEQLRKDIGPRMFDFGALKRKLDGKPRAPLEILFDRDAPDGAMLATDLYASLRSMGWEAILPGPIPSDPQPDPIISRITPKYLWAGLGAWGLAVVASDGSLVSVRDDLAKAISAAIPGTQVGFGQNRYAPVGTIRILIGPKP